MSCHNFFCESIISKLYYNYEPPGAFFILRFSFPDIFSHISQCARVSSNQSSQVFTACMTVFRVKIRCFFNSLTRQSNQRACRLWKVWKQGQMHTFRKLELTPRLSRILFMAIFLFFLDRHLFQFACDCLKNLFSSSASCLNFLHKFIAELNCNQSPGTTAVIIVTKNSCQLLTFLNEKPL